ncbi:MAG: hypothetical protein U0R69_06865 [Gaiellales bacterium]
MSLEVGELADELGGLVGLREPGGLPRGLPTPQLGRDAGEAGRLVRHAPGSRDERDRAELRGELVDAAAHVPLEGERRVLEPPLEHALVARAHELRVTPVGNEREASRAEREVALMGLHRGRHDPLRKGQVALVVGPDEDERALDEEDDLLDHVPRVAPFTDPVESLDDRTATLLGVGLDTGRPRHRQVRGRVRHVDSARAEAVAERVAARGHPVDLDRDRPLVELRAQPPDRSGKAQAPGEPLHRLPEREAANHLAQAGREDVGQLDARKDAPDVTAAALQLVHGEPEAPGEPLCCLRGLPVLAERDALRGAAAELVRGALGKLRYEHGEPARADQDGRGSGAEVPLAEVGKLLPRLAAGTGRELLAPDLKQQGRHRSPSRRRAARRGARGCGRGRCRTPAR